MCKGEIRVPVAPQAVAPSVEQPRVPPVVTPVETSPPPDRVPPVVTQAQGDSPETKDKKGQPRHPIPPWGWIFIVGCGLMPVATLGGAIPAAIGFGAAGGCLALARDPKRSVKLRVILCSALLAGVWSYFVAVIVIPPTIKAVQRAAKKANRDAARTQSKKKPSRSRSKRNRTDFKKLPVTTVGSRDGTVDLLKLIDPDRDRVSGDWSRVGGALEGRGVARLLIPCKPPQQYKIELVAQRTKGRADLIFGLVAPNGKQFNACIDSWSGSASGIAKIDKKDVNSDKNPTKQKGPTLTNGRTTIIVYTVKRDQVRVTVDGKELVDWAADYKRVSRHGAWSVPRDDLLYIAINHSTYRITSMKLTPLR